MPDIFTLSEKICTDVYYFGGFLANDFDQKVSAQVLLRYFCVIFKVPVSDSIIWKHKLIV